MLSKNKDCGLTLREYQILKAIVDGLTSKEIAVQFGVSYNTVSNHVRHIHNKLQVHTRGELVAKAFRENLI